jgi:uncharacterized protein with PIN domain
MERLLLDEMLRRTATWCRILGIDSEFFAGGGDDALLAQAKKEERILITRDLALSKRCPKLGLRCILLSSEKAEEQIAQIISETDTPLSFPQEMRCPECNGELEIAPSASVKKEVPSHIATEHSEFWRCKKCGKIYWEGSHWKNIKEFYGRVLAILKKGKI